MSHHHLIPGAGRRVFFTVRLAHPDSSLLTEQVAAFGAAVRHARIRQPFEVDAWVVLPNHAHAIWTLPAGDDDCAGRWRAIKIAFSKAVRSAPGPAIWQRSFQQHVIVDDADFRRLVLYVHLDPVRHGLCAAAADWPWSSLQRWLAAGLIARQQGLC